MLQLSDIEALLSHPSLGASWEGFVIENIINLLNDRWEYYYYRTATQAEIDLVLHSPANQTWAIEIKRSSAPKLTRGFYEGCKDIGATSKWVITANNDRYPLPGEVEVIGISEFLELIKEKQKTF